MPAETVHLNVIQWSLLNACLSRVKSLLPWGMSVLSPQQPQNTKGEGIAMAGMRRTIILTEVNQDDCDNHHSMALERQIVIVYASTVYSYI